MVHEYTHGLSGRLVGGGAGITDLHTRGMGEGWSDFYALSLLTPASADPQAAYAKAGYSTYQLSKLGDANYYFGIRRYPYSVDTTKNLESPSISAAADPAIGSPMRSIV